MKERRMIMDKNTDEFTIEDILIDDAQVVMVHRC